MNITKDKAEILIKALNDPSHVSENILKQIYVCGFSDLASFDSKFGVLDDISLFINTLRAKIFIVNPQLDGLLGRGLDPLINGLKYISSRYFDKVPVTWNFCVDSYNSSIFLNSSEKEELISRGVLNASAANRILQNK